MGFQRYVLRPPGARHDRRQAVTQVFCSALAIGYSAGTPAGWAPLARLVLRAAYEATLLAAALDAATGRGSGTVLLTFLGGGVFGNHTEWIEDAIVHALVRLRRSGLRVLLVHYGAIHPAVKARIDDAFERACADADRADRAD